MTGLNQLIGNVSGGVAIEGETDPRTGGCLLDGEVDAHHLARGVQEGASTIARVDRRIGLDGFEDGRRFIWVLGLGARMDR